MDDWQVGGVECFQQFLYVGDDFVVYFFLVVGEGVVWVGSGICQIDVDQGWMFFEVDVVLEVVFFVKFGCGVEGFLQQVVQFFGVYFVYD